MSRILQTRSQRRSSSVSSLCNALKFQEETELTDLRSRTQTLLSRESGFHIATKQLHASPAHLQTNALRKSFSEVEFRSALETYNHQSTENVSDNTSLDIADSSHDNKSSLEEVQSTKRKTRTNGKSANNKKKNRKNSKQKKSSKRQHNTRPPTKYQVPSVFERLAKVTKHEHCQGKSSKLQQTNQGSTTIFYNQSNGNILQIKRLHTSYMPAKKNYYQRTFLLLPKVPVTKNRQNSSSSNANVALPRELFDADFQNKSSVVCKKIYLSEMQSRVVCGVPSAPPGTPCLDQLRKVEYIPSLMDVKSQRAVKAKLDKIVQQMRIKEQHQRENAIKLDQKKLKESLMQLKSRQRAEIYALNKVMTELENENFQNFMNNKETVTLGV